MAVLFYIGVLIFSFIGIAQSASLVVSSIVKISRRFRISNFTLGFFVLGIVTTTPELFIGINSALDRQPQLSLGNLLGGTIVLLSLVIGLTAVLNGKISFNHTFSARDLLASGFLIVSPVFFILDGRVSRFDGLALITVYILFFLLMNKKETLIERVRDEISKEPINITKLLGKFLVGVIGLFIFSKIIVEAAILFASVFSIPLIVLGLLLLSLGTNLPEFSLAFASTSLGHKNIAIGDFLGSCAANVFVLGIVALICPFEIVNDTKFIISLTLLLLTVVSFSLFAKTQRVITRKEGFVLLIIYAVFLLSELITITP